MIVYLDSSAIVPLLVDEPTTTRCRVVWDEASTVLASELGYVECVAAIARAERMDRVSDIQAHAAVDALDVLWGQLLALAAGRPLVRSAANLARRHRLRAYDAVHCATALQHADSDVVAVAGDAALLAAWRAEGLAVVDTNP